MNIAFDICSKATRGHSVLVGDYNFDFSWKHEQKVIDEAGWEDICLRGFMDENRFTMPANAQFRAWRPDKVVMETLNYVEQEQKPHWKPVECQIVGDQMRQKYVEEAKNEETGKD